MANGTVPPGFIMTEFGELRPAGGISAQEFLNQLRQGGAPPSAGGVQELLSRTGTPVAMPAGAEAAPAAGGDAGGGLSAAQRAGAFQDIGAGLGGAVTNLLTLFGVFGQGGEPEILEALRLLQQVREPGFDFTRLTPAQLQFISAVDPVFFEAQVPDEVKLVAESEARPDQQLALEQLQQIAAEGLPLADRLAAEQAQQSIAQEGLRGQEAVLTDLGQRGRLGGGAETTARIQAQQALGQLQGDLGRQLAQEALQRRFAGISGAAGVAGDIRSQDLQRQMANQQAVNRFNEFISGQRQEAARFGAESTEAARLRTAQEQQRIADFNRLNQQATERENIERFNRLQDQLSQFRQRQALLEGEALRGLGARREAERDETIGAVGGLAGGLGRVIGAGIGLL